MAGFNVHGEAIIDGDASGGIDIDLFESGSVTTRTLEATEFLHVVDVKILCETGGDVWLVADSKAAGRYLVNGSLEVGGGIILHFDMPFVCPRGIGLKFYGATTNINSCIVEGFITEA